MDLFGGLDAGARGAGDGSLRGEAAATLALAKSRLRAFGEEWHELHSLSAALRSPSVAFCPEAGEPALRSALAALVAASDALAAMDPALLEARGVDMDAVLDARDGAHAAIDGMRGPIVTHERVRAALSRRWADREVASAVRLLFSRLDAAGPEGRPEAEADRGPAPSR